MLGIISEKGKALHFSQKQNNAIVVSSMCVHGTVYVYAWHCVCEWLMCDMCAELVISASLLHFACTKLAAKMLPSAERSRGARQKLKTFPI